MVWEAFNGVAGIRLGNLSNSSKMLHQIVGGEAAIHKFQELPPRKPQLSGHDAEKPVPDFSFAVTDLGVDGSLLSFLHFLNRLRPYAASCSRRW